MALKNLSFVQVNISYTIGNYISYLGNHVNFFKNNQGFSLVETMVAAGMLGLLAMAGVKLMQNQNQAMKTIEVKSEYNGLMNDIRTILADSNSCRTTLGGRDAKNHPAAPAGTITQITQVTATGPVARYTSNPDWRVAQAYGNGKLRIIGIRLSDAATDVETTGGATPQVGTTNLIITFTSGLRESNKQLETFEKMMKLNVTTVANSTNIADCSSTVSDNSLNDMTKACASIGGTYDQASERCNLTAYTNPFTPATFIAVSTKFLDDWATQWLTVLDQRFVNVTGDTMTGALTMQQNINMAGASSIQFPSDRRKKKDIEDLQATLIKIRQLQPKSYKWKANNQEQMGLIAQELQKIYPTLVQTTSDGTLSVDYIQLTPVLIQGVKELDKENKKLKTDLDLMRAELCKDNPAFKFCKR